MCGYAVREIPTDAMATSRSTSCAPRSGPHTAGLDADEPLDARRVRAAHPRDPRHRARCRRAAVLRRRESQRHPRQGQARANGIRCDAHQSAQDLFDAARRRRAGCGPVGARRPHLAAVPAAFRWWRASRRLSARWTRPIARNRSGACPRTSATPACCCAPTCTCAHARARGHAPRRRVRDAQRQLPDGGAATGPASTWPSRDDAPATSSS